MFALSILLTGCTLDEVDGSSNSNSNPVIEAPVNGEIGVVTNVIDGDTIDVAIGGIQQRIRYIGMNTPERDEPCYSEARDANAGMVRGQTVTLVRDTSDTDRFGRLLRYVYVGNLFVNGALVEQGWAEAVEFPPNTSRAAQLRQLEQAAAAANIGCHPTGIFNDGTQTR